MTYLKTSLTIIFTLIIFSAKSQSESEMATLTNADKKAIALQSIEDIHNGVLIVRLSSNTRKTEVLKKQIDDPYSSSEQRLVFNKMLKKSNEETRENNELLMDAFSKQYDFSEVFFVYDTSIYQLSAGHQKGFFLSENLEIDPTINLANRPYRMARYGSPLSAGHKEMLGIVVMDTEYIDLPAPFPYKSTGIRSAIVNSEKRKSRLMRHFTNIVSKLNQQFHIYFQKYKAQLAE